MNESFVRAALFCSGRASALIAASSAKFADFHAARAPARPATLASSVASVAKCRVVSRGVARVAK
jgi:hypothetical protein